LTKRDTPLIVESALTGLLTRGDGRAKIKEKPRLTCVRYIASPTLAVYRGVTGWQSGNAAPFYLERRLNLAFPIRRTFLGIFDQSERIGRRLFKEQAFSHVSSD